MYNIVILNVKECLCEGGKSSQANQKDNLKNVCYLVRFWCVEQKEPYSALFYIPRKTNMNVKIYKNSIKL